MTAAAEVEALLPDQQQTQGQSGDGENGAQSACDQQYEAFQFVMRNFAKDLVNIYCDFVSRHITNNPCWVSAAKNTYMSIHYTIKFPVAIWFMFFMVFGIFTLLAPVLLIMLTCRALSKLFARICYPPPEDERPWTFGSVAGGCGAVLVSVLLFATALSAICLTKIALHPFVPPSGHEDDRMINSFVANDQMSGASFYAPVISCLAVGLYTAITAMEISSTEVILMYTNQDFVDSFTSEGKKKLKVILDQINENVRFMQKNEDATYTHHQLFDKDMLLLNFDLGGGASKDDIEEYCSLKAIQQTNAGRLLHLGACGWSVDKTLGYLALLALVNTLIPFVWMHWRHPRAYLHDIGITAMTLVVTSKVACFITTFFVLLISWVYGSNVHQHLVRKAFILFLSSPEASRRFIFNIYKDNFLHNVALYDADDERDPKEKSLQDLFLFSNKGEKKEKSWMPRLPVKIALERVPGRSQLQEMTAKFLTQPQISLNDSTQELLNDSAEGAVLQTDLYRMVMMWIQMDALVVKTKMATWMQFVLASGVIVLVHTVATVFFWKLSFTSMSAGNSFLLVLDGYIIFSYFSYSLWYHRIHNEHSIALLQNWQEAIRRVQERYITKREVQHQANYKMMCMSERVGYYSIFRALLDPIAVMASQTAAQNVPMTIFGFSITEQTVVRTAVAVATALGTGLLNFISKSEQLESAQEWAKSYIQSA